MFKFEIGTRIAIAASSEEGEIIARAQYQHMENQYYLRYKAADGRATESWWGESALRIA
jgi:uncharacterized beta-barrel protein YwiB (DUF1934 family)